MTTNQVPLSAPPIYFPVRFYHREINYSTDLSQNVQQKAGLLFVYYQQILTMCLLSFSEK